jgi:hypothetical protein
MPHDDSPPAGVPGAHAQAVVGALTMFPGSRIFNQFFRQSDVLTGDSMMPVKTSDLGRVVKGRYRCATLDSGVYQFVLPDHCGRGLDGITDRRNLRGGLP